MHPRDEAGVMWEATAAGTNPASAPRPGETAGDAAQGADSPARAELELRVGLAIDALDLQARALADPMEILRRALGGAPS